MSYREQISLYCSFKVQYKHKVWLTHQAYQKQDEKVQHTVYASTLGIPLHGELHRVHQFPKQALV